MAAHKPGHSHEDGMDDALQRFGPRSDRATASAAIRENSDRSKYRTTPDAGSTRGSDSGPSFSRRQAMTGR